MGFGIWELLVVLLIVLVIFGTKRLPQLKNIASDLGSAISGFRKAVTSEEHEEKEDSKESISDEGENVIEGEVKRARAERRDV